MKKATIAKLLVVCLIVGMMGMSIAATSAPDVSWTHKGNNAYEVTLGAEGAINSDLVNGTYTVKAGANKLTVDATVAKGATLNVTYGTNTSAEILFYVKGEAQFTGFSAQKGAGDTYSISGSVVLKDKDATFKYLTSLGTVNVSETVSSYVLKKVTDGNYTVYSLRSPSTDYDDTPTTPTKPTDPTKPTTPTEKGFVDVPADAYYADAVAWAIEKGITQGLTNDTFGPDQSCTRAQMVTFLWRLAGSPKASGTNPFGDIAAGSYYYDAVMWAVANGITSGTADDVFSPDATVNRAQSVTFLYRYAGQPAGESNGSFTDVTSDAYYANAVAWAAANGITQGTSDTTFSPDSDCVRGQIVTFMYRYAAEK